MYEELKRAGGRLTERQVAGKVLPPFLAALQHLHSKGIVHRDVKPENILLAAAGDWRSVRVADFGLSINAQEERPVTRCGTLDYMPPEVLACPDKTRPDENKVGVEEWGVGGCGAGGGGGHEGESRWLSHAPSGLYSCLHFTPEAVCTAHPAGADRAHHQRQSGCVGGGHPGLRAAGGAAAL